MRISPMITLAIGAAALSTPALALELQHMGYGVVHHVGGDRHHDGRSGRHGNARIVVGDYGYADGGWAMANNRSWDSDSFNDWWHDRPDRAYPRWVQDQQRTGTCDEDRMWWSGTGWRC